ncbi:MAG: hypothetical protein B6241_05120 [Spirochaetaceae bacterium 4572_59]|nr:MAG: hypothetical protein B6241_05120 [Spirochaetaceae bacterium 4572_59]
MGQYTFKESVNYPPWVGSAYGAKESTRILIIGRCYYDAHYENHTIPDYIKTLIKTGKEDPFFNAAELIISDKQHWKKNFGGKISLDLKKFWNSVAYHQFLQGILDEPYAIPSRQMWKQSQEIFKHVILSLEPEIIVIFSHEVFDNIPTMGGSAGENFSSGKNLMKTWNFRNHESPVSICRIMSPQKASFQLDTWKNLYHQFLAEYKNRYGKVYF